MSREKDFLAKKKSQAMAARERRDTPKRAQYVEHEPDTTSPSAKTVDSWLKNQIGVKQGVIDVRELPKELQKDRDVLKAAKAINEIVGMRGPGGMSYARGQANRSKAIIKKANKKIVDAEKKSGGKKKGWFS
jgi:hypothetical protein